MIRGFHSNTDSAKLIEVKAVFELQTLNARGFVYVLRKGNATSET